MFELFKEKLRIFWLCISLFSEKIKEIKSDQTSGASQIAQNALGVLGVFVQTSTTTDCKKFVTEFTELGKQLFAARPNMAPVQNLVAQVVYEINSMEASDLVFVQKFALTKINELIRQSESAVKKSAELAATLILDSDIVATCSYSSTIFETFKITKRQGKSFKVFVAESKTADNQFQYGERLATFLESISIPVQVFPDNKISEYVPAANCVFVGADSLLCDGSIVNGTPTYDLAVTAKNSVVPFYSVCETAKTNTLSYLGKHFPLKNGFDAVPSDLLTGVITEKGILNPDAIVDLIKEKAIFLSPSMFTEKF